MALKPNFSVNLAGLKVNATRFFVFFVPIKVKKPTQGLGLSISSFVATIGNQIDLFGLTTIKEDIPSEILDIPAFPLPFPIEIDRYMISWEDNSQYTNSESNIVATESIQEAGINITPSLITGTPKTKLKTLRSRVGYSKTYQFQVEQSVATDLLLSVLESKVTKNFNQFNDGEITEESKQSIKVLIVDGVRVPSLMILGDIQKSYDRNTCTHFLTMSFNQATVQGAVKTTLFGDFLYASAKV